MGRQAPDMQCIITDRPGSHDTTCFRDGENWLKMRRAMNPLMLKPEQTNIFFNPCQHVADSLVNKWKSHKITSLQNLELQLYKWSLDSKCHIQT